MRRFKHCIAMILLAGCTAGPRASMFDPVGRSPVELMKPEVDPFLETPAIPKIPQPIQPPALPKLGPISSAARQHMWRAARSLGPEPQSLTTSIPTAGRMTRAPEAGSPSSNGKQIDARQTSIPTADGIYGFVQIMPPPPEDVGGSAAAPRESRYFELPPPPDH